MSTIEIKTTTSNGGTVRRTGSSQVGYHAWCDREARACWAMLGLDPDTLSGLVRWDESIDFDDDGQPRLALEGIGGDSDAERRAILDAVVAGRGSFTHEFTEFTTSRRHYVWGGLTAPSGEFVVVGVHADHHG
ncbi:MAG TPA: hypothetical protein VIQ11_04890, partial [Mycobacterium sp.]